MKKQRVLKYRSGAIAVLMMTGVSLLMPAFAAMTVTQLEQSQRSLGQSSEIVQQPFNDQQSYYVRSGQALFEGGKIQGSGSSAIEISCENGSRIVADDAFQFTVIDSTDGGCSVFLQYGALTVVSQGNVQVQMQNAVASASNGVFRVALDAQGIETSMHAGEGAFDYHEERFPISAHTKIGVGALSGLTLDTASKRDVEAVAKSLARIDAAKNTQADNQTALYQARKQFYVSEFLDADTKNSTLNSAAVERYTLEIELSAEIDAQDNTVSTIAPDSVYQPGGDPLSTAYDSTVNTNLFNNSSILSIGTDQYGRPVQ